MHRLLTFFLISLIYQVSFAAKNGFEIIDPLVPLNEIVSGGPPRDGIPAIDLPKFDVVKDAQWLADEDRVLGIEIAGKVRAYPVRILNWHELVNDHVADQNFTISYCPLCGSGMAFTTNIADTALIFGVSGLLYNSDMLLYDRNSESLWSQLLAKAISGPLKGAGLPQIPVTHTTWKHWKSLHPETVVLSRDTGFERNYKQSPYRGYEKSRRLFFEVNHKAPKTYHPKESVLGVEYQGQFKAYPFIELEKHNKSSFPDTVGGESFLIHWDKASQTATIESKNGQAYPSVVSFWFAWFAFHPETDIFQTPPE